MANIITENNFGLTIPLTELKNIRAYIDKNDYESLLKSVKKNREKFIIETHTDDILKFLQE
jgi:hypothetical protein